MFSVNIKRGHNLVVLVLIVINERHSLSFIHNHLMFVMYHIESFMTINQSIPRGQLKHNIDLTIWIQKFYCEEGMGGTMEMTYLPAPPPPPGNVTSRLGAAPAGI